jgi:hypothetical protein
MQQQELLREAISVRSVPKCYKQDKSRVQSVVRQSPASKAANTENEAKALEAVIRQRLVKTEQTEKTVRAVVDCKVY